MVIKKQLHVARDLASLKESAELDTKSLNDKNLNTHRRFLTSLIRKADVEFENGDEESAYLLYMRYANLAVFLCKKYRLQNRSLTEHLEKAVSRCEQLSESLKQRYEQARIEADLLKCPGPPDSVLEEPLAEQTILVGARDRTFPVSPPEVGGAVSRTDKGSQPLHTANGDAARFLPMDPDPEIQKGPSFVTSAELRNLILKREVLVLDVRPSEAFADSHMNLSSDIVNISEVFPGVTAHTIAESLSGQSKELFNRRKSFQKIVVVDWEGQDPTKPYTRPYCVSEALKKWVPSEESITCEHLKSGYKLWTMTFPHDTTNPIPDHGTNIDKNCDNPTKVLSQAENLRTLSWLPEMFEREVKVVPSSSVVPIVAPRLSKLSDNASERKTSPVSGGRPESLTKPDNAPSAAQTVDTADSGAIPKDIDTSKGKAPQRIARQPTKVSDDENSVPKTRMTPEVDSNTVHRQPRTSLMRSRSMSDIYDDTTNRDSFSYERERNDVEAKKPTFDRTLKPSESLEATITRQPAEVPRGTIAEIGRNHPSSGTAPVERDAAANKRQTVVPPPTKIERARPALPPKNRRSQSPVQAYIYGTIDRTAGLRNLRNTCYLNSVIQALAHSTEFAQFFVRKEHLSHIRDPKRGNFATLFAHLLAQLWSQTDTREALTLFREQIGIRCPTFRSSEQQDSHEFLMSLLTVLHEDLNVVDTKSQSSPDDPDLVVTFEMLHNKLNEFFVAHQERQRSIVTANFEGILLSGLKCLTCEKDSYTFQVFNVLSVPIPSSWPEVDLQACFDQFFREETVGEWLCPHCKKKRSATKQIRIARLPKHLVIHLIRFENEPWNSSLTTINKVNNRVYFNEDLDCRDFSRYVYSKNVQLKSYKLYGIVKHHGTLTSGHYIAQCRFLGKQAQRWYCYNDQEVTPLRDVIDVDNAYMLFYSCLKNG